jgi:hypothetical protein
MKQMQKVMLLKEDAEVLRKLLESGTALPESDAIREKLEIADVVGQADFDYEVARLNSLLLLRDKTGRRNFQYRLAVPERRSFIQTTCFVRWARRCWA